jgi:hypothetical protein
MSDTIKIGAVTYQITEYDWPPDKDGGQAMGRHAEFKGEIMLMRAMPPDVKRAVLWHEAIHAILEHAGQPQEDSTLEGMIDAIAHGVCEVLQDNLWLSEPA